MIYYIDPVTKPRMTQRDRWSKRPCVLKYWAYKDKVQELNIEITPPCKIMFNVPMPKSWSKKKKAAHEGKPHLSTPDVDNFLKGLMDAVFENDSHIWSVWAEKRWSETGSIEIIKMEDY